MTDPHTLALSYLDLAERLARNTDPKFDNTNSDCPLLKKNAANLLSKLLCLQGEAASQYCWTPEFYCLLKSAHSVRARRVGRVGKERLRSNRFRCVACGRNEHCSGYTLDVLGRFNHKKWFGPVEGLQKAWNKFATEYSGPYQSEPNGILVQDYGSFPIGETCMNRALIFHRLNSFFMELVYDASSKIGVMQDNGIVLSPDQLYTVNDQRAAEIQAELAQLMSACVDPNTYIDEPPIHQEMWNEVDNGRSVAYEHETEAASGEETDDEEYEGVIRRRSDAMLDWFRTNRQGPSLRTPEPSDVSDLASHDESEENDKSGQHVRRRQDDDGERRRRKGGKQNQVPTPGASSAGAGKSDAASSFRRRKRARVLDSDCEDAGDESGYEEAVEVAGCARCAGPVRERKTQRVGRTSAPGVVVLEEEAEPEESSDLANSVARADAADSTEGEDEEEAPAVPASGVAAPVAPAAPAAATTSRAKDTRVLPPRSLAITSRQDVILQLMETSTAMVREQSMAQRSALNTQIHCLAHELLSELEGEL